MYGELIDYFYLALPRRTMGGRLQVSDLIKDDLFAGPRPAIALSPSGDGKEQSFVPLW